MAQEAVKQERSLGELFSELAGETGTLVRQEVALAKAELKDSATKGGKAAGMLGGAGYAGHLAVVFLSITLWMALAYLFDDLAWWGNALKTARERSAAESSLAAA